MYVKTGFLCISLIVTAPGAVLAWKGDTYNTVNPVSDTVFEVVGKPGSDVTEYWCSAGDYARRVLGAAATRKIYLVRGLGRSETSNSRSAVQFSLIAPGGSDASVGQNWSLSVDHIGDSLNAAVAQNYCLDRKNLEF